MFIDYRSCREPVKLWLRFVIFALVTACFAGAAYLNQRDARELNSQLGQIKKTGEQTFQIASSFRILPASVQSEAIILFRDKAHAFVRDEKREFAVPYAQLILVIDRKNGHGLYYLGESLWQSNREGGIQALEDYLAVEPSIPLEEKGNSRRPRGFFDERTAFVALKLAEEYTLRAQRTGDRELLRKACERLSLSKKKWSRFATPISTEDVEQRIKQLKQSKQFANACD